METELVNVTDVPELTVWTVAKTGTVPDEFRMAKSPDAIPEVLPTGCVADEVVEVMVVAL